ncbi:BrnT family toxin [uncultured Methylobacterium sp.]|uniref:BrnT family toxin n=1 Tax=uncultured Methylobacterium sp. TaxID=157278 RepID=UPI0035C9BF02
MCGEIFDGTETTREDKRFAYGEARWVTASGLDGRMVIVVWTERDGECRIISLRKANEREQAQFGGRIRSADVS